MDTGRNKDTGKNPKKLKKNHANDNGNVKVRAHANIKVPVRYLPNRLTPGDITRQVNMLLKSKKLYTENKYYTREKVASYESKPSQHVKKALNIYKVDKIVPSQDLSRATGCSVAALKQIVKKGEGAYYSSGSRPNQTPQSWGFARLASSLTSGKAAAVDYKIIENGCDHKKKAFILANKAKEKYNHGNGATKKRTVNI